MMKRFLVVSLLGLSLSSCIVNSLERNRQAVDTSTCSIMENTQAIEEANRKIQENSQKIAELNKVLEKAG